MSLKNDPASVIADPQWLPSRWDRQAGTLQFVRLSRADHDSITFLGDEYLAPLQRPTVTLGLSQVLVAGRPPGAPAQYIFHSAFCCSTLLARALDVPGTAMALKEPQVLNTLTEAARAKALSHEVLQVIVGLLARPFGADERVVVKPSNAVNFLATGLLEFDPGSNAIFLYAPLPRFLRSVADKGLWGRVWARQLFMTLRSDTGLTFGFSAEGLLELTDLQVAALAWLMHHAQAAALIARLPGRVRTLDSETFLERRTDTLVAAAAHFGLPLTEAKAREIAGGPVFETHSKRLGQGFDPDEPLQPKARVAIIDEEIEMVAAWTGQMATHNGIAAELLAQARLLA
jgi:hypothetical protein